MASQSETCRRKALECERRAALATGRTIRRTYAELAQLWREMADQAEELERKKIGKAKKPTKT